MYVVDTANTERVMPAARALLEREAAKRLGIHPEDVDVEFVIEQRPFKRHRAEDEAIAPEPEAPAPADDGTDMDWLFRQFDAKESESHMRDCYCAGPFLCMHCNMWEEPFPEIVDLTYE